MDYRIQRTIEDLVSLNADCYCELGPGTGGVISLGLKEKGQNIITVEAPWAKEANKAWAAENDVKMYLFEFFTGDFDSIEEEVDCFFLAHAIAHFRFSPYIFFEKIYNKLPSGGYFYLSTVNGSSFDNVLKLFRGQPVTGKVTQHLDPGFVEVAKDFNRTDMRQIWDDWMHVKEYTMPELEEMFTNLGFEIHYKEHRKLFSHWKRNLAIKLFPHLADELVIIGRKP
ncbi:MAG: class I SAM-dependent methyltransferase [Flavobacteriales bacterium]|nr:class I SAM-dependent methyltransferase [Flavobacteriales bacterium]